MVKLLSNLFRRLLRPRLVVLDIYGLERESMRFVICHGDELADNFFVEGPLSMALRQRREAK